jgi:hypothetical protein
MGKGIAIEFRRRWPAMFEEYKLRCQDGLFKLGDLLAWDAGNRTVFNLGTQLGGLEWSEVAPVIESAVSASPVVVVVVVFELSQAG